MEGNYETLDNMFFDLPISPKLPDKLLENLSNDSDDIFSNHDRSESLIMVYPHFENPNYIIDEEDKSVINNINILEDTLIANEEKININHNNIQDETETLEISGKNFSFFVYKKKPNNNRQ